MGKPFGEQLRAMTAKVQETFEIAKSIVATGKGRGTLKLVLVGGDDRALRGPWPPWYDVVHFDKHTTMQRVRQVLQGGTVDAVVIFTKWKKSDLSHVVRKTATCPVYYWPTNPDQLARNIGQFIEKKQRVVVTPQPQSDLLLAGQKLPLPAPAESIVVEDAQEDDGEPFDGFEEQEHVGDEGTTHFAGDDCSPTLPPQLSPEKKTILQRSAELLSKIQRRDAWNRDEWEMLLIALEEAGSDGKKFIKTMKTLGSKRTVAAMLFALDRAAKQLGMTLDAELLRQLRHVSRREWKRQQQKKLAAEERLKQQEQLTQPVAQAVPTFEAPPAVQQAIMRAGMDVASASDDDRFRKTVDFIVLGVEIGRMTKEQGFDEIVKLLGR